MIEEKSKAQIVEERASDFKHSFETPTGKRTCEVLSKFCFEKDMTYVENSDVSAFREGKRAVILEIRRWLNYDLTKLDKEQDHDYDRIS